MTIQEIADELGFTKVGKRWYSDFYLDMLDCTPYQLGEEVYVSDGMYIQEPGLTDKQLREEYEENLDG